ncbi:ABC transporter permease/substrate-binding protein [Bacillus shivajii]|uniref:ABC transporter permease/substrate-binding protein n=1 Tax=Bacillus shivajii TaxID=1983719 RepID=UPI001CF972FA|nr:ABC transporter permease/substrate-binding protein [Bacillus shivajii]UCZ51490.1 ABC transporter permease/substrate-binding protein [Bacillus shivajii]
MEQFWRLTLDRHDLLIDALWEHIHMSLISLLLAVFIAVPLGIYLSKRKRFAEPIIGTSAVLQTIPSLALLGFMIPLMGIGTAPAIVALTVYALLPILRNTYTGINEVDPSLMEASRGMGMGTLKQLHKIELPLAIPMIMAGIRTSMVLIIGTATLAALIGAGGLGDLIMLGIQRNNSYYILLGAIPAAALALFFDAILRLTEKWSAGRSIKPFALVVIIAVFTVFSPHIYGLFDNTDHDQDTIVIGGKLGAEPEIVINMYKLLIEQESDLIVDLEPRLGNTDIVFQALVNDDLDAYFEFTGTAIANLLDEQLESNKPHEAYEQAREGMYKEYNLIFLEPFGYQNTYALAVTEEVAEDFRLETVTDLLDVEDELTAGFTHEFSDRMDGYLGIQELYGLDLGNVQTMDAGLRSGALVSGDVQMIDAYSTDAYMIEYNLVVLEDDKNFFPPYNGAPLFREDTLEEHPEIVDILNMLSGKITEREMQEMNYRVDYEDEDAYIVAKEYLEKEGLLAE